MKRGKERQEERQKAGKKRRDELRCNELIIEKREKSGEQYPTGLSGRERRSPNLATRTRKSS